MGEVAQGHLELAAVALPAGEADLAAETGRRRARRGTPRSPRGDRDGGGPRRASVRAASWRRHSVQDHVDQQLQESQRRDPLPAGASSTAGTSSARSPGSCASPARRRAPWGRPRRRRSLQEVQRPARPRGRGAAGAGRASSGGVPRTGHRAPVRGRGVRGAPPRLLGHHRTRAGGLASGRGRGDVRGARRGPPRFRHDLGRRGELPGGRPGCERAALPRRPGALRVQGRRTRRVTGGRSISTDPRRQPRWTRCKWASASPEPVRRPAAALSASTLESDWVSARTRVAESATAKATVRAASFRRKHVDF